MKKNILSILLYSIFIIIFNIVFFLLKAENNHVATWISYAFIHVAYVAVVITQFMDKKHEEVSLNLSSYLISSIYFVVAFITAIIFIIFDPQGYRLALVIQVIYIGIYLILLLTNLIANRKTVSSLEAQKEHREYVKTVSAYIKKLKKDVRDEKITKKLDALYDVVHASPIKTTDSAYKYEKEIEDRLEKLEDAFVIANSSDIIREIESLIDLANMRNDILKATN